MKFKNVQRTDSGVTFDVEASNLECSYLVNFAVERLLQEGIIAINERETEQEVFLRETTH
jgi:hypothetical protein